MAMNMTEGKPYKVILKFAIPMLLGNLFQQAYNLVDTIIVGKFVGESALAAVGTTGSLLFFMTAIIYGLCNGASIIISQYFGSKNREELRNTVVSLGYLILGLTVFISVIGFIFAEDFLVLLKVPDNIIGDSTTYVRISFVFMIGVTVYNGGACVLRSMGDSKTPLYALMIGAVTNIVLDLVFIIVFHMGVAGAAYATVISQILSAIFCFLHIYRIRKEVHLDSLDLRMNKKSLWLIIKTGVPSAFQSSLIALGGMSVQGLINSFGSTVISAYAAVQRIDSVAIQIIVSLGTSLSVFTGQNIGSGKMDRIKTALRSTLVMMTTASVFLAITVLIFKEQLLGLFLDRTTSMEAIKVGAVYLSIIGIAYIISGVMNSYLNLIRGAGDVNASMVAGIAELGARIIFAYLLVKPYGITGIWMATPISWGCGCVIPVVRYYMGTWKHKKIA